MSAHYYPQIFDVADIREAKSVILTDEGPGADPETRWVHETPYVLELLNTHLQLGPDSLVLDYGCGIGRVAKAMIAATGCSVIGVDLSPSMRQLAVDYVASPRFMAISREQFDTLVRGGLRMDAAISIWVLQHCFAPVDDLARVRNSLAREGRFVVLNMPKRAIPAVADTASDRKKFFWAADACDVARLLRETFRVDSEGVPDRSRIPNTSDVGAYWMYLSNEIALG